MPVNWLCGDIGLSVGVYEYVCMCGVRPLLASLCPCGLEPEVIKGCWRESGLFPTFSLVDTYLLLASVSLSLSEVVWNEFLVGLRPVASSL